MRDIFAIFCIVVDFGNYEPLATNILLEIIVDVAHGCIHC